VTASFSVNPVTGTSSVLTLTVGASVTPDVYNNLDVRGAASGLTDVTTPLTLTVTAVAGSYTMALSGSAQSIAQGANANTIVTLTRTNFTGGVTLSATGLPTGVTAAFAPNPATANTSTLTLTVGATVTAGVYNLTIVGAATGLANVTTPLALTVTSSGTGGAVTLDYSACTGTNTPVWVAYQDGGGGWTHVAGTGNVYHFTISSGKGAFAAVTVSSGVYTTTVNYFSQAEFVAGGPACTTPSGNTVTGTVSNPPVGSVVTVSLGRSSGQLTAQHTFTLSNVANGSQTLVAYKGNPGAPAATDATFIGRGVIIPGSPVVNIDFSTAATVQSSTFTVAGGTIGDAFITSMALLPTSACIVNSLYSVQGTYTSASSTQYGISAAQQSATDFHRFTAEDVSGSDNASSNRLITVTFQPFTAQSVTLPAALPVGTLTTLSGGIGVRRQIALTLPADYSALGFSYTDAAGNVSSLFASALYLGGSAVTLGLPDFSAAGGYLATYGAGSGTLSTALFALGSSGAVCTQGATTKVAIRTGTTN
jgi:hypothetical protein